MSYLQAPCGQRTTPNPCLRLTFDRVKSLKIHHAKTVLVILGFFELRAPSKFNSRLLEYRVCSVLLHNANTVINLTFKKE